MRTSILAALALSTVALSDARPASARVCQTCSGPSASAKSAMRASREQTALSSDSVSCAPRAPSRACPQWRFERHSGMESYYHEPERLASGGWFNPNALTAVHKTLPFGTKVRVTNNRNGRDHQRSRALRGRSRDRSVSSCCRRDQDEIRRRGAGQPRGARPLTAAD